MSTHGYSLIVVAVGEVEQVSLSRRWHTDGGRGGRRGQRTSWTHGEDDLFCVAFDFATTLDYGPSSESERRKGSREGSILAELGRSTLGRRAQSTAERDVSCRRLTCMSDSASDSSNPYLRYALDVSMSPSPPPSTPPVDDPPAPAAEDADTDVAAPPAPAPPAPAPPALPVVDALAYIADGAIPPSPANLEIARHMLRSVIIQWREASDAEASVINLTLQDVSSPVSALTRPSVLVLTRSFSLLPSLERRQGQAD